MKKVRGEAKKKRERLNKNSIKSSKPQKEGGERDA